MNVFADLGKPIVNRPGTGVKEPPKLDEQQHARARRARRYPAAPKTPWGLRYQHCEVLKHASEGLSLREIGEAMDIGVKTVENHVAALKVWMRARNFTHAVVMWDRHIRSHAKESA